MKTYDELVSLFEEANLAFLQGEHSLFRTEVAERTLCGVLMLHIHDIIKEMTLIRDITRMWSITEMQGVSRPQKTIRGSRKNNP